MPVFPGTNETVAVVTIRFALEAHAEMPGNPGTSG